MVQTQPMKMAAAEALWESENPASFSLFTIGNEAERQDVFAIRIPGLLSLLAYNRLDGEVRGINDLQASIEQTFGPGNYVPPVAISYWTFRLMVGAGLLMALLALLALYRRACASTSTGRRLLAALLPRAPAALPGQQHRLDPHRAGPPAVDRLRAAEHRRRRLADSDARHADHLDRRFTLLYAVADRRGRLPAVAQCSARAQPAGRPVWHPPASSRRDGGAAWTLNTLWFVLIGVLFIGFFFLEGFDYGVGILTALPGEE